MVEFIPAEELKQTYGVFGHFYSVELASREIVECRSVLEIVTKASTPKDHSELSLLNPDAVFIMMNPGSSRPLVEINNRIRVRAIHKLAISLVPTKPNTTQYQVMRLMHYRQWRHVRVLNLSDLRSPKSPEFIKLFQRLESAAGFDSHSVVSDLGDLFGTNMKSLHNCWSVASRYHINIYICNVTYAISFFRNMTNAHGIKGKPSMRKCRQETSFQQHITCYDR